MTLILDKIDLLQVKMLVVTPRAMPVAMPPECHVQIAMPTARGLPVVDHQRQVNEVLGLVVRELLKKISTGKK